MSAGWIVARFGPTSTLYAGPALQIAALVALAQLDPGWSVLASVWFLMAVQGASGVAKCLAKMSAKSAGKPLTPAVDGGLFLWIAALTGFKNSVKEAGFFLGAALLGLFGFAPDRYSASAGAAGPCGLTTGDMADGGPCGPVAAVRFGLCNIFLGA